jgi:two-component system, OmpR family, KDP operon response regulator KdpE
MAELGDSRPESAGLPGPPGSGRAGTNAVLLVEDQPELLRALSINLRARQYDVLTARTGREALAVAASHPPDAVILDLGLPDIDGTEVIVELRRWSKAPIIVLSGRSSPGDKIGALDVGADDYVTKPFAMAELLARLRAALRRDEGEANLGRPHQATIGRWLVNLTSHQVTRAAAGSTPAAALSPAAEPATDSAPAAEPATAPAPAAGSGPSPHPGSAGGGGLSGAGLPAAGLPAAGLPGSGLSVSGPEETLRLTPTEWRILEILLQRPGQLVGSAQILTGVWGPGFSQRTNYLRFHMARLRRKLEDNPARPRHLLTEPGMGYRYQP